MREALKKLSGGDETQKDVLEKMRRREFSWDDGKIGTFLDEAAGRLGALYEREVAASQELAAAIG